MLTVERKSGTEREKQKSDKTLIFDYTSSHPLVFHGGMPEPRGRGKSGETISVFHIKIGKAL